MDVYETYTNLLVKANKEKISSSNMLSLLKFRMQDKPIVSFTKLQNRNISKTPPKAPSKYLSSEKLKKLTKQGSKSPFFARA
jgi:hypothetical protein